MIPVLRSQPTRCELPIVIQKDINAWLHQSLPLCILLAHKELHPWYYERYIQIYSEVRVPDELLPNVFRPATSGDDGYEQFWVDFFEEHIDHRILFHRVPLSLGYMERETDIIKFVQNALNEGYYPGILLDNFFLPERPHFQKYHAITQALIYGYDTAKQKILTVGFGHRSEFKNLEHDYSSFVNAYEGAISSFSANPGNIKLLGGVVELLKVREFIGEYPFGLQRFLSSLENYLSARVESGANYFISSIWLRLPEDSWQPNVVKDRIKFGHRVYEDLEQCLEMFLDNRSTKPLEYPQIHFFFDHKQSIYKRIQYLHSIYRESEALIEIQNSYKQVVDAFNAIRMTFLVYSTTGDKKIIRKILASIGNIKIKEFSVLNTLNAHLQEIVAAEKETAL